MATGDATLALSKLLNETQVAYLERAIATRTAERKRVSPRRRWLMEPRLDSAGWPPILVSSDSVASSHSWNPPRSNSRYFFW